MHNRTHSTGQRSSGGGGSSRAASSGGSDCPSAEFYQRQQALLERKKQREAQRRPSDEDELDECVCEWLAVCRYLAWLKFLAESSRPCLQAFVFSCPCSKVYVELHDISSSYCRLQTASTLCLTTKLSKFVSSNAA